MGEDDHRVPELADEAPNDLAKTRQDDDEPETEEKDGWLDILGSGQLKKKVITPGKPDSRPVKPDMCTLSFTGRLEDGEVVDEESSITINLGDGEVIQGIDFALALMDEGETAELVVSPRFAYGAQGNKPKVPSNATLVYTVTLERVEQEPNLSELDAEKRLEIGLRKKGRGNWWYLREDHTLAIHSYRRALEYLDDADLPVKQTENENPGARELLEERLKTYNNLGAAQLKINALDAALTSFDHVLICQPDNVKALFRKGKILRERGELEESIGILRKALTVEPNNRGLQQELSELLAAQRRDNTKQRNLYKKMLGNSSSGAGGSPKKKKAGSNGGSNLLKWASLATVAIAVAGAALVKLKFY